MKILTKQKQNDGMRVLVMLCRFVMTRYKRFFEQDEDLMNAVVQMFIVLAGIIGGWRGVMLLDTQVFDGYRNGRCVEIAEDEI